MDCELQKGRGLVLIASYKEVLSKRLQNRGLRRISSTFKYSLGR